MSVKTAKRKAGAAVKDIIDAARRYIEAEQSLEKALRADQSVQCEHREQSVEQAMARMAAAGAEQVEGTR